MALHKIVTLVRVQLPTGDELAARANQHYPAVTRISVERHRLAPIGSLYLEGVRLVRKILEGLFELLGTLRRVVSSNPEVSRMLAVFTLHLPVWPGDAFGWLHYPDRDDVRGIISAPVADKKERNRWYTSL